MGSANETNRLEVYVLVFFDPQALKNTETFCAIVWGSGRPLVLVIKITGIPIGIPHQLLVCEQLIGEK